MPGFIIYNKNSVSSLSHIYNYRKPRIVKAKQGWYIKYYYRIPVDVRHLYDHKEWLPFRFTEGMNRRKGKDREEYAEFLVTEITNALKNGYNPFTSAIEYVENEAAGIILPKEMIAQDALQLFLDKWGQRGLAKESMAKYRRYVGRLMDWLREKNMLYNDVKNITVDHIEAFLSDNKKKYNYGNREYNNAHDFIRTAFNYLLKKKMIDQSPMVEIDKLKTKSSKHRYYDEKSLDAITRGMKTMDPYTYLAFQTVYYLCVRSEKELKSIKVGNIQWKQNMILAEAEGTKGGSGRYIPMDENIKQLFIQHKVNEYPPDYYLFGIKGTPAAAPFGKGFFSKRFKKIRETVGLPSHFTIYGAKHTRIIHLKQDGLSDADIMALTGHKDFGAYAKYLRDLGLSANPEKINKLSRVI
jgi:site-specific recombinase XerD